MARALTMSGLQIALLVAAATLVPADDDAGKSRSDAESKETVRLIEAELPRWKIWKGPERHSELKLQKKPLLRWTNPGTGRIYGDLYVWTAAGRPEVMMSLFKAWEPAWGFTAEVHSLSLGSITAERDGTVPWEPDKPGVVLRDVPDAPAPAETATRRLAQMKKLAGGFSAYMIDYRRNPDGERQALRLLPQPIYRYQSSDPEVTDGAMFGFVLGTDAEVLLLIEARASKDALRWQYAFARLNNDALIGEHDDDEVWRVERARYENRRREGYMWMGVPETPAGE